MVTGGDLMTARSFDPHPAHVVTLLDGRRVHRDHAAHAEVTAPRLETVRVPDGVVAIDTGESVEGLRG
jgi:hypothetical protein